MKFQLTTNIPAWGGVYYNDDYGDLTIPEYILGHPAPEEVEIVLDEYGYKFEFTEEDEGIFRYEVDGHDVTLDLTGQKNFEKYGREFHARIDKVKA